MGNNYGLQTKADLYADCTIPACVVVALTRFFYTGNEHIFDTKNLYLNVIGYLFQVV